MAMDYREDCLARITQARSRIDDALVTAPTATRLLETWHEIWEELQDEAPPEADRMWLADRLGDLRTHVQNSPRWRELI